MFHAGSKGRLTSRDLDRFPTSRLFDRLARAVCRAGCLPRKELYETWEVARRARRLFRGGRIVDIAGGHGLLAYVMLLLDDTSASAIVVDPQVPKSAAALAHAIVTEWPRLDGRVSCAASIPMLSATDVIVSSHACGALTDDVIAAAMAAEARVAVLPCCQQKADAPAHLAGWLEATLGVDVARAERLRAAGYQVRTQRIPAEITPKNRLLLGTPGRGRPAATSTPR